MTSPEPVVQKIQGWQVRSHTFLEIGHEILIQAGLSITIESMKQKYVQEVLVNLPWKKSVVRLTDRTSMTIAVDWA